MTLRAEEKDLGQYGALSHKDKVPSLFPQFWECCVVAVCQSACSAREIQLSISFRASGEK